MASKSQESSEKVRRPQGGKGQRSRPRKEKEKASGEAEPVLSGRLIVVATLFLAMAFIPLSPLSALLARKSPKGTSAAEWKVGSESLVHLTVITADYNKLACAGDEAVGSYHCAYTGEKKPRAPSADAPVDDNKKHIIQPYRTTDGSLILIPGLWAQPPVATRLHREPPQGVPEKKLARFVVECRVKFLAEWKEPLVRWAPGQAWSPQGNGADDAPKTAPVAEPQECRILERQRTS